MPKSTLSVLIPLLPVLLSVFGLALLVVAAFTFALAAGLAAAGVALLLVAYQLEIGGTR